jgi:transcriptional regulator with XRE-family HTH domain
MAKSSDILKKFGIRIRDLRLEKGFTSQIAFSNKTSLDLTYVGGIERGERNVSLLNIEKIVRTLEVSIDELFRF